MMLHNNQDYNMLLNNYEYVTFSHTEVQYIGLLNLCGQTWMQQCSNKLLANYVMLQLSKILAWCHSCHRSWFAQIQISLAVQIKNTTQFD